ncbi:hypothetical protein [Candidatus Hodarchaeum mangrovi]
MKDFQKISKNCIYRNVFFCSYWDNDKSESKEQKTQCHFLHCPIFSGELRITTEPLNNLENPSIVNFTVDDFDNKLRSVQNIIEEFRKNDLEFFKSSDKPLSAISVKSMIKRMVCAICGENIDDEKYIMINDPTGVQIYIHSKGKCAIRFDRIKETREKWLSTLEME